jgi:16S rRNA (uracil1498-N3)-methyltransferase
LVERTDSSEVATFFSPEPFSAGTPLTLGEDVAHHARVTRLAVGSRVGLRDGVGGVATGILSRISKSTVVVDVAESKIVPRLPAIHLLPPIADRERMLWLGEKAAEFGIATWRPVMWRRSKSVSPRGEGPMFNAKLRARMISALIQSGGAWLPDIFPEATVESALAATPAGARILLDKAGDGEDASGIAAPVSIAIGPEGGFETAERDAFLDGDFKTLRLSASTLRFETAAIAGIAVVTSRLTSTGSKNG